MMKTIAIIGRPNVGKSTLFNRLVGRRVALVHPMPGMTRDRRESPAELYDLQFKLVDTAGLADPDESVLTDAMRKQTLIAIRQADIIILVIDGREGCTPYDRDLANMLRRESKPILVLANKCEGHQGALGIAEAAGLGLGDAIPISAEHGLGMSALYEALLPYFMNDENHENTNEDILSYDDQEENSETSIDKPIKLTIVGRPNVGKSTLINKLIGEERLLTADMPGVTRDAISVDWTYLGKNIELIDTAGLRRRGKISASSEKLAVMSTHQSIQFAEVVILVIDATMPFEKQDLAIAHDIINEGRALIIALNKWDLVKDKAALQQHIKDVLDTQLTQVRGIPCLPISAKEGKNLTKMLDAVLDIYRLWNMRLSTSQLNRWLEYVTEAHPAPMVSGRRIRLKYMTQIKTRPPTFAVFASKSDQLPDSYSRYLINQLRKDFKLNGVPIRIQIKETKNPYAKK
jgi:GTP-binding protein